MSATASLPSRANPVGMTETFVLVRDPTEVAWSALVLGRNGMLLMLAVIWGFWLHNNERRQRDLEHVA